jgi:hypothetical protein
MILYFSGVTERDPSGIVSGKIDKTDWRFDGIYCDPHSFQSIVNNQGGSAVDFTATLD